MKDNQRPALWVGHVTMSVSDPQRSHDYYVALGMRSVLRGDKFAITELRGGTHLILEVGVVKPGDAPFDLMVDDLSTTHTQFKQAGFDASDILTGDVHNVFVLTDPDGQRIVVFNSHVVGAV